MRLPVYGELHGERRHRRFQAAEVKQLLKQLKRDNPDIEKSVFNSIHSVCLDTMPGWKTKGRSIPSWRTTDRVHS